MAADTMADHSMVADTVQDSNLQMTSTPSKRINSESKKNSPIGVFDSGIGGVTVLKSLIEHFPTQSFIYLGDTARLPYGSKSPTTIFNYSEQNIKYLYNLGVQAIVIACNSASSHYTKTHFNDIPVFGVVQPSAQNAVALSKNKKIGVLGTRATVQSQSYVKALLNIDPNVQVIQEACPLFVPLAEEGLIEDPVTEIMAQRYLEPLIKNNVDTIILGCTHYPILLPTLKKIGGSKIQWIESGNAIVQRLQKEIQTLGEPPEAMNTKREIESQKIKILTTDESSGFKTLAQKILNLSNLNFELVNTQDSF